MFNIYGRSLRCQVREVYASVGFLGNMMFTKTVIVGKLLPPLLWYERNRTLCDSNTNPRTDVLFTKSVSGYIMLNLDTSNSIYASLIMK